MFTPINIILDKKKENPNFRIFNIQKKCIECEKIIFQELGIDKVKVLNIKNNIITVSCQNKTILNEIQLRKKTILNKIKTNKGYNIKNIKTV
ncbi:MAG: hypothetical protein US71_C0013G0008 [Parcubacteria group bacterium GW2011_GWD2_38_12]|nr:MAG: hypothetical protein US06_C0012G0011 [Parcubacteria group bacterium GW2011_GWC2_36_17]KKQ39220.1 MAG: hypothetical protein US56_C0022G0006 [Candidatus Moranbacteria bacterium GW2011_GWF2_37_7]KKQ43101.1 MAG: hypothetical protein US61_C0016G0007 [Parcubacteria group bacterium GW2011_GWE2_37_8]KKQ51340.1 MAG: hypothetical protein US71_C0013G0008 [Parcubacteria group bacterium GW2011_GWD2_38_12]KKQ58767.1 MAG: hypothetical protein US79_C0003G0068 [Parcubacteria group bacterium GW2011_GWC1_